MARMDGKELSNPIKAAQETGDAISLHQDGGMSVNIHKTSAKIGIGDCYTIINIQDLENILGKLRG